MRKILPCCFAGLTLLVVSPAAEAQKASVASLRPEEILEFESQPDKIKRLIEVSLGFTEKNLGYRFGSNSPENKGMDCSGTVQCVLRELGLEKVPRSSGNFHEWVEASGEFVSTAGTTSTEDPVFEDLKPGDLLFWEGTYDTGDRESAISHVMIFLGTHKEDGKGIVFGASNGRRYRGKTIHGVSVFDWVVPGPESSSRFVGYAPIPGFRAKEAAGNISVPKRNSLKSLLENLVKKREASLP